MIGALDPEDDGTMMLQNVDSILGLSLQQRRYENL
jgi:hypothetical protein